MLKNRILIIICILCFSIFSYKIRSIITPFAIAALCGYLLSPLMSKLKILPKSLRAGLITILFFLLLIAIITLILPIIYHQVTKLIMFLMQYNEPLRNEVLPKLLNKLELIPLSLKDKFEQNIDGFTNYAFESIKDIIQYILESGFLAISTISVIAISPVITFYVLKDLDALKNTIKNLIPHSYRNNVIKIFRELDSILFSYLKGQVYVSLILIIYYCTSFKMIGVESGLALGFLSGLMIFIPYIGIIFSSVLALSMTYVQFQDTSKVIIVAFVFIIAQICEGCFITPKLVGDKVGLHPVWVIFGLFTGGVLFGFIGILTAIPLTAMIGVFIRLAIIKYKNSQQYNRLE